MYYQWKPYVPVSQRRATAAKIATQQVKRGIVMSPVVIAGRVIATSFWGKSWCTHLESYSDYENRLPRGRAYARNGSVIDLQIARGVVTALVSGSSLYKTTVTVKPLNPERWKALVEMHATQVSSVVDLLQGKLPRSLLEALADKASGLFPTPKELTFACSCPDWASMCKHVAAVLYGVGSRLDSKPELFFHLRGVEVSDLAAKGADLNVRSSGADDLASSNLGAIFGIELAGEPGSPPARKSRTTDGTVRSAAPKARPAKKTRAAAKPKTTTAAELRVRGLPLSTQAAWLRSGVLVKTAAKGVFALTEVARRRLEGYMGR